MVYLVGLLLIILCLAVRQVILWMRLAKRATDLAEECTKQYKNLCSQYEIITNSMNYWHMAANSMMMQIHETNMRAHYWEQISRRKRLD